MGVMRFVIHPSSLLDDWPEIHRAYVRGFDGRVHGTRIEVEDNVVSCRRQNSDSGKLYVALPIPGFGRPVVNTSSLPEREVPYLLLVELARGKLAQVRDQLAAWEMAGMTIGEDFHALRKQAQDTFAEAVARQDEPAEASELARKALELSHRAAQALSQSYVTQRLAVRRVRTRRLPASLGCGLGHAPPDPAWEQAFNDAFTAASVPIEWRSIEPEEGEYHWEVNDAQVEWCEKNKLMMTGGPLLDLSPDGLPQWLWQWEHDFLNLQSFVCDFVETAITRYAGRVRFFEVSARANTGGALALSEDDRLSLVARTLDVARQIDEENHLLIRVDQPWGAYQARGQHRYNPLQFVDALVRSGVGLSGVNLEIGVGYVPRGTALRDLLDFSQLIDLWSCLGIPLHVTLAFPSGAGKDRLAKKDLEVDRSAGDNLWTEAAQAEFVERYLPMLMSKQVVVGIFWCHASDASAHHFPNAGLVRPDGSPKPALDRVVQYRREYWT
jgi:GH35 family endo-1,4-beta-xylanase